MTKTMNQSQAAGNPRKIEKLILKRRNAGEKKEMQPGPDFYGNTQCLKP